MRTRRCLGIWAVVFLFCNLAVAMAQVTTGTISGTVQDSTGAVIPSVNITIRNTETGLTRTVASDEAGRYRAPNLPLGAYEVEAAKAGFQTEVRTGITLTVGREAVVNLGLRVGAVAERVEVTGEAPLVETRSASMSYLVDEKKIRDLPLNGRNYTQLAMLQPGVASFNLFQDNLSVGHGQTITISGARNNQNLFLLDGQDIGDYNGRTPGSVAGANLGIDAIREFTVLVNSYSAEFGTVIGGVMNVVTQSGTNRFHGSVFEFLRNSALDAKNFFDRPGTPIPPFKRNQFGGTLSGPIRHDRTFFLGAYEGLRERLGTTRLGTVPNARAHQGFLPDATCPDGCGPGARPGERLIGINPIMRARMDVYPVPNGRDFGDGTGLLTTNPNSPSGENYFTVRLDHQLTANNSLFGRYTFDDADAELPMTPVPIHFAVKRSRFQYAAINWTSILSPASVNEARVGFNRSLAALRSHPNFASGLCSDNDNCPQLASVRQLPGFTTPWNITSPFIFGGVGGGQLSEDPRQFVNNVFEFSDNVSYLRGRHSLKMGAGLKRYYANPQNNFGLRGGITFATLRDFMQGTPVAIAGQDADSRLSYQQSLFGWFVQDDIQVNRNLTLNVGIRHEFTSDPVEKHGRLAALRHLSDPDVTIGKIFTTPKANFVPRVGLAWDVLGNGRLAMRMGAGVFHEQLTPMVHRYTYIGIYPFIKSYSLLSQFGDIRPDLSVDLNALPRTALSPRVWEFEPSLPAKYQWSYQLQGEIMQGTTVSAAYIGARFTHNELRKNWNPLLPGRLPDGRKCFLTAAPCNAPGRRFNPLFTSLAGHTWEGDGYYNALQLNLAHRFARGLQFQGAYTWSRTLATASASFAGPEASNTAPQQDSYNIRAERSLAAMDLRHNLTANVTYDLPFGSGLNGAARQVLAGWQVNLMSSLRTGFPFSVNTGFSRSQDGDTGGNDRPDLAPGMNNSPVTGTTRGCAGIPAGEKVGTPERYFDPCVFVLPPLGTYGNVGQGTIIGPGFVNFDFAVNKAFNFTERINLQFRAEFFNLFNHANFRDFNRAVLRPTGEYNGSAGRILDTANPSRQIQFGLKLSF